MEKTKYSDHEKLKFESFKHLETLKKKRKTRAGIIWKNNMQDNFNLVTDIHCKWKMLKKGEICLYKGCYMPPVTCAHTQTETKAVVNRLKAANISSEEQTR